MESRAGCNAGNDGACVVVRDFHDTDTDAHDDDDDYRDIRCTPTGVDTDVHTGSCCYAERAVRPDCQRQPRRILGARGSRRDFAVFSSRDFAQSRAKFHDDSGDGISCERRCCDAAIRVATVRSCRNTDRADITVD